MKTKRHWKNLAVVAVMGLAIAVQSVMPVNAALVCGKCGQKISSCPQGADDGHYYFVDETEEPWAGESRHRVIVR